MSNPLADEDLTLPEIAAALEPPDPALLDALLASTNDTELVVKGRLIASSRVVTDVRRIYAMAYAFYTKATLAQRKKLRGFSPKLLAIAVAEAVKLDEMMRGHEGRDLDKEAIRAARGADLRDAFSYALALRDQFKDVLLSVAGQAPAAREEIEQAVGTADRSDLLVRGLQQLSAIGKRFLKESPGPLSQRAELFQLDQEFVQEIDNAADRLQKAADASTVRPAGSKVNQGDLDRSDGINLLLLGHIIRAFENAHDQDPTIPKLAPIATRRMFGRTKSAK